MFEVITMQEEKICLFRKEIIPISSFACDHMQIVEEVAHFKTIQPHILHFDKPKKNYYLILYVANGNALYAKKSDYQALLPNATLIQSYASEFSIYIDDCEVFYAYIHGESIQEYLKQEHMILDIRFRKKSEIFFHSVFLSLDKYDMLDEYSIASSVLRLYSDIYVTQNEMKQCSDKQEVINVAIAFMEQHYQKDIRLKDISAVTGYSEYYFLRIFKEIMHMTPYEYLVRKRLSQVKILLLSTHMTIEEIALECGFKSDISLYKTFKNIYSITPREYKKSVGK